MEIRQYLLNNLSKIELEYGYRLFQPDEYRLFEPEQKKPEFINLPFRVNQLTIWFTLPYSESILDSRVWECPKFVKKCIQESVSFNIEFIPDGSNHLVETLLSPVYSTESSRVIVQDLKDYIGEVELLTVPNWIEKARTNNSTLYSTYSLRQLNNKISDLYDLSRQEQTKAIDCIKTLGIAVNAVSIKVGYERSSKNVQTSVSMDSKNGVVTSLGNWMTEFIYDLVKLSCNEKVAFQRFVNPNWVKYSNYRTPTNSTERLLAHTRIKSLIDSVEKVGFKYRLNNAFNRILNEF